MLRAVPMILRRGARKVVRIAGTAPPVDTSTNREREPSRRSCCGIVLGRISRNFSSQGSRIKDRVVVKETLSFLQRLLSGLCNRYRRAPGTVQQNIEAKIKRKEQHFPSGPTAARGKRVQSPRNDRLSQIRDIVDKKQRMSHASRFGEGLAFFDAGSSWGKTKSTTAQVDRLMKPANTTKGFRN